MKKITQARYEKATECFEGFCTTCQKFTRGETEGDAEGYECPACEQMTVMGCENALIAGEISV